MRDRVLTIRVTREQYEAIELFAQAGLAASRSEAAARIIEAGLQALARTYQQIRPLARSVHRVRRHLQAAASAVPSADPPPPPPTLDLSVLDLSKVDPATGRHAIFQADLDARDGRGWTLLHHAAHRGDLEVIYLLLVLGADPLARSDDGRTPRDVAGPEVPDRVRAILQDAEARVRGFGLRRPPRDGTPQPGRR